MLLFEDYTLAKVNALRASRGLSMYWLAKVCDIPRSTLQCYIRGNRRMSVEFVGSFCKAIDMPLAEFYADYDAREENKKTR